MRVACICPTYKRPKMLANAIACFEKQTYNRRYLFVLDDAGQYAPQRGKRWQIVSTPKRFGSLPAKFNSLVNLAGEYDAFVVWEDDDVYLPWHIEAHVEALDGNDYSCPGKILSNYGQDRKGVIEESGEGRFHASWAFTRGLFVLVDGYPVTQRPTFDQEMLGKFREIGRRGDPTKHRPPSYVYRWGSGKYNGSAFGKGYYHKVGQMDLPDERIEDVQPRFDAETKRIYKGRAE